MVDWVLNSKLFSFSILVHLSYLNYQADLNLTFRDLEINCMSTTSQQNNLITTFLMLLPAMVDLYFIWLFQYVIVLLLANN